MKWIGRNFWWRQGLGLLALAVLSFLGGARWGGCLFARLTSPTVPPARVSPSAAVSPEHPTTSSVARQPRPVPAEFEEQAALILGCTDLLEGQPRLFVDVVAATYRQTFLIGLVASRQEYELAVGLLRQHGLPDRAVCFVALPVETMWARDYGPFFLRRADGSCFIADAELPLKAGATRTRYLPDDQVPSRLGTVMGLEVVPVPMYLIGGNLLSNGDGLCLTSTKLAAYNRLRGYDNQKVAAMLQGHFGFTSWVCVRPLAGETTGDVDMFAAFLAPNVAVVGEVSPSVDPENAQRLDAAAWVLAQQRTSLGPMRVHRVPMPPKRNDRWRTYTNVAFANGVLLVPTYADVDAGMQDGVLALYARLMPGWKVVGIRCDDLAARRGVLHCITREVPKFVSLEPLRHAAVRQPVEAFGAADSSAAVTADLVQPRLR
ncbi:MAG: agmatine deiminase family protein [Phycisphaerae bacterium]